MLVLAILCNVIIAYTQNTNFNFTNKPFSDPEMNNYHRGAHYWNGTVWDNAGAPQVPPGTPTTGAKTFYRRWWWTEVETNTQGVYKFTKASQPSGNQWRSIEWGLEWCANNGALLGIGGIMTAWDGQGEIFYDGAWSVYPQYLHNLMQTESVYKDWVSTNSNSWIPNWNSQYYLDSWKRVNDTLIKYIKNWKYTPTSGPWVGKLIEGWKIIDFVDVKGYGNYGEWHEWPWAANDGGNQPTWGKPTDSTLKKIIDIAADTYGDYPLHINVGVFDNNPWGEGTPFSAYYAMNKKTRYGVLGWRRDNIGGEGTDNILKNNTINYNGWRGDTTILNRWKYAMITGEPLNGGEPCCPYFYHIRPEIKDYHYAGFGNGNYGNNSQQTWDTIQAVFKLTGYRYNLNGGSMTTTLIQNSNFDVKLNWRNVGASPLYQKRWRVVYQLKTAADVEVKKWVSKFNPYLFLPNSTDSIISETFALGSVPLGTTYKLTVKFEDTVGLLSPLFIAINSPTRNADGSYTLRSNITVLSGTLPVTFNSFDAKRKGNGIELTWNTNCTNNNQKYEVERSYDGVKFDLISIINAQYGCLSHTYKYTDWTFKSTPVYYRIKQMDMDGAETYSRIVKVGSGNTKTAMALYPNPFTDELTVVLDNTSLGRTYVLVNSVDGKLIKQYQLLKTGEYFMEVLDMKDLQSGIYFVKIVTNGTNIGIKKLVKN